MNTPEEVTTCDQKEDKGIYISFLYHYRSMVICL